MRHQMFGFYIGFSRQRTLGGKRFFSASLAALQGIADVFNTKSQRCQPPTLEKALDVPRSEHFVWTQPQDEVHQRSTS